MDATAKKQENMKNTLTDDHSWHIFPTLPIDGCEIKLHFLQTMRKDDLFNSTCYIWLYLQLIYYCFYCFFSSMLNLA